MTMNEVYEMCQFCFPWSLVALKDDVVTVDHYSISKTSVEAQATCIAFGGSKQLPGYIVIREDAPDENIIVESMSVQQAIKELAKALAVDSVARAFEIYDPCMVVTPLSL